MYRGDVRATWPQSKISTSGQSRGRAAKCLLAAVAHVKEAVLVLVRVVYTSHQASCGYTLHHHYQSNQVLFYSKEKKLPIQAIQQQPLSNFMESSFDLLLLRSLEPSACYNIARS